MSGIQAATYDLISKKKLKYEEFLSSGTFIAKSTVCFIQASAAGGGGDATTMGGASGAACDFIAVPLEKGASYDVVIGAGGAVNGTGGSTTFKKQGYSDYLLNLPGGQGGDTGGFRYGGMAVRSPLGETANIPFNHNSYSIGNVVAGASVGLYFLIPFSGNSRFASGGDSQGAGGFFGPGGNGVAAGNNTGAGGGINSAGGSGKMIIYYEEE